MRIIITESQYKRLFEETVAGSAPTYDDGTQDFIPKSQIGITSKTTSTSGKANKLKTKTDGDKIGSEFHFSNNTWSAIR